MSQPYNLKHYLRGTVFMHIVLHTRGLGLAFTRNVQIPSNEFDSGSPPSLLHRWVSAAARICVLNFGFRVVPLLCLVVQIPSLQRRSPMPRHHPGAFSHITCHEHQLSSASSVAVVAMCHPTLGPNAGSMEACVHHRKRAPLYPVDAHRSQLCKPCES